MSFTTDKEKSLDLKSVVHMEEKKPRGRPHTKCVGGRCQ